MAKNRLGTSLEAIAERFQQIDKAFRPLHSVERRKRSGKATARTLAVNKAFKLKVTK